jgi:hypothetical protein
MHTIRNKGLIPQKYSSIEIWLLIGAKIRWLFIVRYLQVGATVAVALLTQHLDSLILSR